MPFVILFLRTLSSVSKEREREREMIFVLANITVRYLVGPATKATRAAVFFNQLYPLSIRLPFVCVKRYRLFKCLRGFKWPPCASFDTKCLPALPE